MDFLNTRFLFFFLALIIGSSSVNASEAFDPASGIVCKKPKSQLYKKENSNDALELELIADFSKISKGNPAVKGVLKYNDSKDGLYYMPVELSARGNTRGTACSFKPFRITFGKPELASKIEALLDREEITAQSEDYLKVYYNTFLDLPDSAKDGKPKKKTLFGRLGDDVKVVTHCGAATYGGEWPGGLTEVDQDQRLLAEYYLYEALSTLRTTIETTRLAKIKYYSPDGKPVFTDTNGDILPKFAFFREPPTSMAKRCQLLTTKPTDQTGQTIPIEDSLVSEVFTNVVNKFIMNTDYEIVREHEGKNIKSLYDSSGKRYFATYDFDLASPINDYFDANAPFTAKVARLRLYLGEIQDSNLALLIVNRFIQAEEKMKTLVAAAILNDQYKSNLQRLLNSQYKVIHEFASNTERNTSEPKE